MSILNDHACSSTEAGASSGGEVEAPASASQPAPARKLRLKVRAERMGETRQRIARAAYELHASVGPARTTISAIAERAGVQRLTVYKHFPDDREIVQACTAYHRQIDPPPDPAAWRPIADPEARLRQGLAEVYAYYRRNESLLSNIERDVPRVLEQLGNPPPPGLKTFLELPQRWHAALAEAWTEPTAASPIHHAALALAIEFTTWRTLARGQARPLDDPQVADLMTTLIRCAAQPHPR
ncbi:MAG: helix-turn-helix domain-containing protein [Chloroflexota bacterium]